jgi:undecaprenyl-diphosphatase
MEWLQALLLGIIEGLTEFLPISSTGHLVVAEKYINFRDDAKVFTVVIQSGAILAVIWYYRNDLVKKIAGFFKREKQADKFWINLVAASIPAGILGLLLDKQFERYATVRIVAWAMILGGIVLWLVDRKPETSKPKEVEMNKMTAKQSFSIGLIQCLALIPGVSRSGSSIVGGLLMGLNRPTATAFSFYLGIPILGFAGLYKLSTDWNELDTISGGSTSIIIGLVVSFITALIAVAWLLKYVSTHNFRIFAYYRIIAGILILLLLI